MSLLRCARFVFVEKYKARFLILASLVIVAVLISAGSATADGGPEINLDWGIMPTEAIPWFSLDMQPGDTFESSISAVNQGAGSVDLNIAVVTVIAAENGGWAMTNIQPPERWVILSRETITVQPRSIEIVDFELNIPAATIPGEYALAFVAWESLTEPDKIESGFTIKFIKRIGVPLIVKVGDPQRCEMVFQSLETEIIPRQGGTLDLQILPSWLNSGEVSFKGHGSASLIGENSTLEWPLEVGYVAMGVSMLYPLIANQPAAGEYVFRAHIESIDGECSANHVQSLTIGKADIRAAEVEAAEIEEVRTEVERPPRIPDIRINQILIVLSIAVTLILIVTGRAVLYSVSGDRARRDERRRGGKRRR